MGQTRIMAAVAALAVAVGAGRPAQADGVLLPHRDTTTSPLAQARQEAILVVRADKVTYVLRTLYEGRAGEFAWIIPVPAEPTNVVAHADDRLFSALAGLTEPTFDINVNYSSGGCGLACAPMAGGGPQQGSLVVVEAQGRAGIYDWAALTSAGGSALLDWLQANEFSVPDAAGPILDGYIQQGMHFLAVRIHEPANLSADGLMDAPPIQFDVVTTQRLYPMSISQISAKAETEVVLYVLAAHRAEAANVPNGIIDPQTLEIDYSSISGTNYERLFTDRIAALDGLAFITECAAPAVVAGAADSPPADTLIVSAVVDWPEAPAELLGRSLYVTRLRSLIPRERMDFDLQLQDATTDANVANHFSLTRENGVTSVAVIASAAGLAGLCVMTTLMRRSYRRPRTGQ